jgi:PKD repeat protein
MGCDEFWEHELAGPLSVGLSSSLPEVAQGGSVTLLGSLTGNATRVGWDFGDGLILTNESRMAPVHSWTNTGDYTVTFTAYNTEQINGVSTNITVRVVPLVAPSINSPALSGTNFSLSFTTQPGVTYAVQGATNLEPPVVWQTLTNVYGVGDATVQVVDPKATNQIQFYRIRIP